MTIRLKTTCLNVLPASIAGALLLSTLPGDARAASCAPRDTVVKRLASSYGETRQSIGLGTNNRMMEVFASDESGSWTIIVTNAEGISCLVASGQAFETLAETLPVDDKPA